MNKMNIYLNASTWFLCTSLQTLCHKLLINQTDIPHWHGGDHGNTLT